jgi:UDP-glucuronate 4-epimerase
MSILVTGAAGFIGSHVCDRLLADGHGVWGLDSFDDFYDPARKRANLAGAMRQPSMHLVEGDVRDEILLDGLMSDVDFDAVVHLAARPGVRASLENPDLCYDVNVRGTLRVLDAMRLHEVPVLLFGSSSSVYGESSDLPFSEDATADRPISPYAASKRAAEMLCHVHHHLYGLTVYCLRFFTVYGPRQRPDLVIHKFARLMADGEPVPVFGDGSSRRDYTYIDDTVDGVLLALEGARRRNGDRSAYEVVNLGRNETVALGELVEALAAALERTPEVERMPEQPGDLSETLASVDRGDRLLGYRPRVAFDQGLARFVRWFREMDSVESASPLPS